MLRGVFVSNSLDVCETPTVRARIYSGKQMVLNGFISGDKSVDRRYEFNLQPKRLEGLFLQSLLRVTPYLVTTSDAFFLVASL